MGVPSLRRGADFPSRAGARTTCRLPANEAGQLGVTTLSSRDFVPKCTVLRPRCGVVLCYRRHNKSIRDFRLCFTNGGCRVVTSTGLLFRASDLVLRAEQILQRELQSMCGVGGGVCPPETDAMRGPWERQGGRNAWDCCRKVSGRRFGFPGGPMPNILVIRREWPGRSARRSDP